MKTTRTAKPLVGILMGSDSDWEALQKTVALLKEFGVPCEAQVASAHRTPERALRYAAGAERRGVKVIIAAAGGAAHLAGVVAAHTTLPVIGVPVKGWALDGLDSLLATVQMPKGVPVATVAVGNAGAVNAALLAVQILALQKPGLKKKLLAYRRGLKNQVEKANQRILKQQGISS